MSKSLGNAIDPRALVATYGLDPLRYFVLREVPFGGDGDFSRRALIGRLNGDLANDFGNLVQRVLSMVNRECGAKAPEAGTLTGADRALLGAAHGLVDRLRPSFHAQAFHVALTDLWDVVGRSNRYVDEQAPWALRKTDPARMATVLWVLAETIRHLAILAQPVMPGSAAAILDQLAVAANARSFAALGETGALRAGTPLPAPTPVFPRFVEAQTA
jgi:methionyl-tRNA synthetase